MKGRVCFKILCVLNVLRETGCLRRKWRRNYLTTRRNELEKEENCELELSNSLPTWVQQTPVHFAAVRPNTAHSCSRYGVVAATHG
jgi:hypothetical protein